ncbi:serine-rich adhesin for platelets isoform X3 [Magallana gigas]|uniref:serine-rich adhesin for platelets isoform X3 n=1 Tax=Magallana gigas TaxID=29159 RepID=UPI00333F9032
MCCGMGFFHVIWTLFLPFLFICVLFSTKSGTAIKPLEQVFEACYGVTADDFLEPVCNISEVLYIRDVFTYAKPRSYGCPQESTPTNRNDSFCCRYNNDTTDCGWRYYGESYKGVHYTNCVGRLKCTIQVAWNRTELNCDPHIYMSKSNFMRQFYHCIKTSLISDICTSSTKTGNELYVWNDGYPDTSGDCATSSGCACSVSATKGSTIQVDLLDLRLYEDGVGTCYQRLVISEGGVDTSIDCDKKNEFALTPIYTSQSDSFDIRFDNTHSGQSGNFWIALRAIDSTATLTLTCGNSSAVYSCGESLPTTPAPTIVTSPSNSSSTSTNSSSSSSNSSTTSSSTLVVLTTDLTSSVTASLSAAASQSKADVDVQTVGLNLKRAGS